MHLFRSISRLIPAVVMASLLVACNDPRNVATICANDGAICADLNTDEWCQTETNNLISSRFEAKGNTNEQAQYRLLTALSGFQECIKIAALIEPRSHPELKTLRVAAMLSTYDELIALEKQTLSSNNPYILNYHWVSHNNENAKRRFIALSTQQSFDDPALYFAIANIYGNNNDQVIANLLKGISLLNNNAQFDNSQLDNDNNSDMTTKLLYAIITTYMHKRDYPLAYLWSQVAIISDVENINLGVFNKHKITTSEQRRLDTLAGKVAEQIETQKFTDESYEQTLAAVGL
ncbi:DUF2989 domain-containing protein [Moritella sp. Urea-trap-13]|uniref:DUF2989 domain-containing protein n=1 Tax=Moritella sp. Urea-trap-13 TaxID=2058327 RepID=UPI000C33C851|nr:DUF2989 domain-containing protein [Moritella sp. Urea-trap-13]PKH09481.1 DUF2989 domain-containing protein [Moritella sp. Urea-trap-13]